MTSAAFCRRSYVIPAGASIMLVGKRIGPFIVDKELGSGAMGAVYRGRHTESGRKVAIKVVAPGLAANANALKRFKRETAILKQLEHPNIVKLLASGKIQGTPFYVMEYVEGESLDHVMERRGRITWEDLIPLGQQLCAALQHAHEKGIVHRDLKPANLMMLKDGTVKLADFGIAKDIDVTALTAANSTVGTAAYMSPEQCRGSVDVTNKSDLYSMGVMFYELITGRKPFLAETIMEMFQQHTQSPFPRPSKLVMDIPIWLDNLICQLLEKKPDDRPFNADMVSKSLGMVKEKWETQQSAAVSAAKKRKADRTASDTVLDAKDKETARTLLGKKKKKKKEDPFYRKTWFTLLSVGLVAAGLIAVVYVAFFQTPPADGLFNEIQTVMKTGTLDEKRVARERGPIAEFLRYHDKHAFAGQVRVWSDQVEREYCEFVFFNRRNLAAAPGEETLARKAYDDEDAGRFDDARKVWDELAKNKDGTDPEKRPWGLMAKKHLDELNAADRLLVNLQTEAALEIATKKKAQFGSKAEEMALDAIRSENQKNAKAARRGWDEVKRYAKDRDDERIGYLLAVKRLRDLDIEADKAK